MIQLSLSFLFFIFCCFLIFYLPGKWLIRFTNYKTPNTITDITLSIAVGLCCFLVGTYALSWLHLSFIYLLLLIPFILIETPKFIKSIKSNLSLKWLLSWDTFIILVGAAVMVAVTFRSGMENTNGISFFGINGTDGMYHSALISNLFSQFPPSFPGLSNTFLQGYHFLYDFMLSQFAVFFGFNSFDLYFRFFSIFTAVFYGLSGLVVSFALKMDKLTRRIFLFLLFFAQGGGYFLSHFYPQSIPYNSGIVQPAGNIVDPSVLLSTTFVFLLFTMLFSYTKRQQLILPILFLGILPGVKIYTGILAYGAVGVLTCLYLLKKKGDFIYVFIAAGVISGAIYLPFNIGAGSLVFAPFLLFRHFMESNTIFSALKWPLVMQVYEAHHNIPRILSLYAIALMLFFVPSLGIRLIVLIKINRFFSRKFYTPQHIFWIIFIAIGFIIPILFIQSIAVFNTVQFYWLIWIVLLIPTAFSLRTILGKPRVFKTIFLFMCLISISLPVLLLPISINKSLPFVVSKDELSMATYIHSHTGKETILVVNRYSENNEFVDNYKVPLFAALSQKPMYYEPEAADFAKSQKIEENRKNVVDTISLTLLTCPQNANEVIRETMKSNDIQYLLTLDNPSCAGELQSLENVKAEGNYVLYLLK